jgi:ABC-2 type transport system ATP-binding protein
MLAIAQLTHVYPNGTRALDNVTLDIPHGMFGLLGPNGAGKSSLMRCVATLQIPSSGAIRFGELDVIAEPAKLRAQLGYLPQDFGVYPRVSAHDMLDHLAVLKGVAGRGERRDTVDALLKQVNLWDVRKKAIAGFSGGMRQRFGIAQALIGNPRIIIVDEPTAGLDPEERNRFNNLLSEIGEQVVVILSTHIVDDVTDLCPRMAIMVDGRIVSQGTPAVLIQELRGLVWTKSIAKTELDAARAEWDVIATRLRGGPDGDSRAGTRSAGRGLRSAGRRAGRRVLLHPAPRTPRQPQGRSRRCSPSLKGATVMLRHIAAFEWRYQVKSPVFWVGFALFFLLTFGSVTSENIQIGARGNVNINAPYAILQTQGVLSLFLIFVIVAMVAGVILRDDDTGFAPILRSTSMSRSDYLVGRFIGAIAATFAVLACIPLAIAIGSLMPWLDSEKVGPFHLSHYLYALFAFGLPTLLIIGATCFAFATATRSLMWTYVAMMAMIVLYLVMRGLLSDPAYHSVSALLDPS